MNRSLRRRSRAVLPWMAMALLGGCGEAPPPAAAPPVVLTTVVGAPESAVVSAYSGEVRPRHEPLLSFRVPGKMVARTVDAGARVRAGDVLARLDPGDNALAAAAARAQLAGAASERDLARAELERTRGLRERQFVSAQALEQRENAHRAAQARWEAAAAQAEVSANAAAYTVLRADHDGVVSAVLAEPGQVLAAGQAVLRLAREEEKEVVIALPEGRLAGIRPGQAAQVRLWSAPARVLAGKVREVAPVADPATRTFAVKVALPGAGRDVALGATASVAFAAAGPRAVALLPATAVMPLQGGAGVWVVDSRTSQVVLHPVEVGTYREDGVVILAGLAEGDRVVSVGGHKLTAGDKVRPLEAGPGGAPVNGDPTAAAPAARP